MPFLLAEILNFQGTVHLIGVGSLSQLKEDYEYDQISLKEYIDPFTGEPVKKNK